MTLVGKNKDSDMDGTCTNMEGRDDDNTQVHSGT